MVIALQSKRLELSKSLLFLSALLSIDCIPEPRLLIYFIACVLPQEIVVFATVAAPLGVDLALRPSYISI